MARGCLVSMIPSIHDTSSCIQHDYLLTDSTHVLSFSSLGGSIAVSRSMPAILNDRISSYAWTSICDDIDRALEPLNDAMKRLVSTNIFFLRP